ncbi:MAG TPA: elongation factor Ts [Rhizobiales bacterium]|nr:elongation factor Ts [bacterium BMS3Bbin10]HDO51335.1 elongation factor Ts [Hyphomicrobiales bacterium]
MTTVTAAMVKELRGKTGAGMMDCKTALTENAGDMEAAVDWLRTKGLSTAAKKAGRVAAEGLVGLYTDANRGALVEINSETDFVARNDQFQDMVSTIAKLSLDAEDTDALSAMPYGKGDLSVEDYLKEMVGSIGENMVLRRSERLQVSDGVVGSYVHNAAAPGLGKIGVLVALESSGDKGKLEDIARKLAMHVAAANPLAVSQEGIDPAVIERERAVLSEQARESGKPENIIEKMVEGRLRKYYEEVALLSQVYVIDGESKVADALKAAASEIGSEIKITGFARFALGEGVEKKEGDFAAEVAAAVTGS